MCNGKVTQNQFTKNKKPKSAVKGSCPAGSLAVTPPPTYSSMHRGYIKLWRKGKDWAFSREPLALALWVFLLWEANHKPTKRYFNRKVIVIEPGQLLTGRKYLSELVGVSENTIEKYLNLFEKEQQLAQQKTNQNRLITILNWNKYQGKETTHCTTDCTTKRQRTAQQKDTPKNVYNVKNDNNIIEPSALQAVIDFFFSIKDYKNKEWIRHNYPRHCPAAKRLLALGNPDEVKAMITKGKAYFEDKNLSWKLETIEKHWNEIKRYKPKRRIF